MKINETKGRISVAEIKSTIESSGYLLEQRIGNLLDSYGYYTETNPAYPDPETGKSREYDILALDMRKVYKKEEGLLWANLIIECENNQQPIVFFRSDSPASFFSYEDLKVAGIPSKIWTKESYVSIQEFLSLEKFHHFCKSVYTTQYCSFRKKKSEQGWIALHDDSQHDSIVTLINVLETSIEDIYKNWELPSESEDEPLNLTMYYPVLIVQGDLYLTSYKAKDLKLKRQNHIQFRKEVHSTKFNKTYQVAVIRESYLEKYVQIIDKELNTIEQTLKKRKEVILQSIERIIEDARKAQSQGIEIRKSFEL